MKKNLLLSTLVTAALLAASPVQAATAVKSSIAVINVQQVMNESTAAKSMRDQLENKQKEFQKLISKQEKALQEDDKELSKKRSVLSKEAFEKKLREFQIKATDLQKDVQSKKAILEMASARALGQIQKTTTEIISDLAKEKSFTVALPTSQILYADSSLDISEDVLARLNKKLPTLTVSFEKP